MHLRLFFKLYYAVYYLIRATLASKEIAILRCRSMFRLVARVGEKSYGTSNRKYNTTHEGTLSNALAELENDPYIMCFQEEYAIVAIPIKRMQQTIADMLTSGILQNLSEDRTLFAKSVIGYDERALSVLSEIFA